MAALGAHKSSQESAPTGFGALPQELQIRCVEFLSLVDAASLVKQLSKGTRAAARRAVIARSCPVLSVVFPKNRGRHSPWANRLLKNLCNLTNSVRGSEKMARS
mgnify:CR=1 FL=1